MKKKYSIIQHKNLWGWIFSIQAVIAILVSILYPLIYSGVLSFTNVRQDLTNITFIGWENYKWIFTDSTFLRDLWTSLSFSIVSTAIQTVFGFLLAYMLYYMHGKVQSAYKTILYLPVILPTTVVSAMYIIILKGDQYGVINALFSFNPPIQFMSDREMAFWLIVIINTWRFYGITMVIYLVNMSAVPKEIIESATLDGASSFTVMMKIILPLVASATGINIILSMIGGIQSFDLFYLFQQNGNLTSELNPVGVLIFNTGLGSSKPQDRWFSRSLAMSIVLTFVIAICSVVVSKVTASKEDS